MWVILALVAMAGTGLLLLPGDQPRSLSPPSASSTTASVPPTTTTTGPLPTTTAPSVPVAPQPTPEAAARALMSGWARADRPVALSVATPGAVDTLFAVPYPNGLAFDRGCSSATSSVVCTFGPPGGANPNDPIYSLTVVQTPAGTWYVSDAQIQH